MMEFLKQLQSALDKYHVRVGVLLSPTTVIGTWSDPQTGKAKFAVARVDDGFFDDTAAHPNFIADFTARITESLNG